jgi:hypothetical protein
MTSLCLTFNADEISTDVFALMMVYQRSGGVEAAIAYGSRIYLDATHGLCKEGYNMYNVLCTDGDRHGVIIASMFLSCDNAGTIYRYDVSH